MKIRLDFIMKCAIISNSRGKDVKTYCLIKNGYFAPYPNLRRDGGVKTIVLIAPSRFSLRKEFRDIS